MGVKTNSQEMVRMITCHFFFFADCINMVIVDNEKKINAKTR